jgi:hypothetical protein
MTPSEIAAEAPAAVDPPLRRCAYTADGACILRRAAYDICKTCGEPEAEKPDPETDPYFIDRAIGQRETFRGWGE